MGRKPAPQPLTIAASGEDPPAGETLPISSTPDSTSPRSPRSPFRFAQKKVQKDRGRQPLQPSDVSPHQRHFPDETQYPPISSALHQQDDRPSTQLRPQEQQQEPQPQPQPPQQNQQQQYGHSHRRKDEDKASKSGFFSHFAKSSDRLHTHHQSDSRSEIMSRDSDNPPTSNQNIEQTGE